MWTFKRDNLEVWPQPFSWFHQTFCSCSSCLVIFNLLAHFRYLRVSLRIFLVVWIVSQRSVTKSYNFIQSSILWYKYLKLWLISYKAIGVSLTDVNPCRVFSFMELDFDIKCEHWPGLDETLVSVSISRISRSEFLVSVSKNHLSEFSVSSRSRKIILQNSRSRLGLEILTRLGLGLVSVSKYVVSSNPVV